MGKRVTVKTFDEMTEEELAKWWDERVKGVNFDNREESYNFYLNSDACLICGEIATHWTPAKADGWLMPSCDKHFNNPKITEKQWAKARARAEKSAEELVDLKCCKCGGKPVVSFVDMWRAPDLATPDNITPNGLPLCDKCSLSDEWLSEEYDAARVKDAHNRLQELTDRAGSKFETGQLMASEKLLDQMDKTPSGSFSSFVWRSFSRHCTCDWGDVSQEEKDTNDEALKTSGELFSTYNHRKCPAICILTNAERSETAIGLQADFCED